MVNAIIATSPTIVNTPNIYSPSGTYSLSASDFNIDGRTTWFGALGYVNYLNSVSYGGSSSWYLPTVANTTLGYNTSTNGTSKGDELVELYYQELESKGIYDASGNIQSGYGIQDTQNKFSNEYIHVFWSDTEYAPMPRFASVFYTGVGSNDISLKNNLLYAWAVSPGQIAAVPEPESVAMLLLGLGVVAGVVRRRQKTV